MIWFFTKLQHFSAEQAIFLIYTLTKSIFDNLSKGEQDNIKFLFSKIDNTTTAEILGEIVDSINETVNKGEPFVVYRVSEGGDFNVVVKKKNDTDNYQPFILTARENNLNTILAQQLATNSETQLLQFEDLNLTENNIYKIRIQLEKDSGGGTTNNDAVAELTTLFFVVSNNIDSE